MTSGKWGVNGVFQAKKSALDVLSEFCYISDTMANSIESQLQKIGLNENEAKVYLASLKMGPATAQQIAAKALVSRPNTYIMIESLSKKGIMSSHYRGKKRYFTAGDPKQLLYVIEQQRAELDAQEEAAKGVIDALGKSSKPVDPRSVTVYEGVESARVVWDELRENKDLLRGIIPLAQIRKVAPSPKNGDKKFDLYKRFTVHELLVTDGSDAWNKDKPKNIIDKVISPKELPVKSQIMVYGDKVVITNAEQNELAIHIKDAEIAQSFKAIFDRIWDAI